MAYLFVYGSLHPERAPEEIRDVVQKFVPVSAASVRGRLEGLGPYPGVVLDGEGDEVPGEVFEIPDDPALLERLDAYEEYVPHDHAASLFLREQTPVTLCSGSPLSAWIYVWNQDKGKPGE